jgi:hypothetical protein
VPGGGVEASLPKGTYKISSESLNINIDAPSRRILLTEAGVPSRRFRVIRGDFGRVFTRKS